MNNSPNWIQQLDRWLAEFRPDYYAQLRPGADDLRIGQVEQQLGFKLPSDLRQFYQWRDGQSEECWEALYYTYSFLCLDRMLAAWRNLNLIHQSEPSWWRSEWLPFLETSLCDELCVDSHPGASEQVVMFYHEIPITILEFPSFSAWGETLTLSFVSGIWVVEGGEVIPRDYGKPGDASDAFERFHRGQNPGFPRDL